VGGGFRCAVWLLDLGSPEQRVVDPAENVENQVRFNRRLPSQLLVFQSRTDGIRGESRAIFEVTATRVRAVRIADHRLAISIGTDAPVLACEVID